MLEILPESQANILGVKATGTLTNREFQEVLVPRLKALIQEHGRVRVLFFLDEDIQGWDLEALQQDGFGREHLQALQRIAVVGASWQVSLQMKLIALPHQWRGAELFPGRTPRGLDLDSGLKNQTGPDGPAVLYVFFTKKDRVTHLRPSIFPRNQPSSLLKILVVFQDGLVDEFIEAADPLQLVFQFGIGEDPFAVPVFGDDDDLFDVIQLLIELLHHLLDGTLGPGKRYDVFRHMSVAGRGARHPPSWLFPSVEGWRCLTSFIL